jgi:hypothetical protein
MMNERIRELLKQCEYENYTWNGTLIEVGFDAEKFAKLIVRECDAFVAERYDEMEPWMEPGDLLKHFGVE